MKNILWLNDVYKTYATIHPNAHEWVDIHLKLLLKTKKIEYQQRLKYPIKKGLSLIGLYNFKPINNLPPLDYITLRKEKPKSNSFEKTLYNQFYVNPLPFLLYQYDRASMANGVECRMPFLDYRVVEYIFSLPLQSKIGHGYTKRILREAVKGLLPEETRLKKIKIGFNAPTIEWFKGDLKEWFFDQINSQSFINNPYFNGKEIQKEFSFTINNDEAWKYPWKYWSHIHLNWWLNKINF